MIVIGEVKRQGNSNVIILPKKLGLKPRDKVRVLLLRESASTVGEAGGVLGKRLKGKNTDILRKQIKEELWGE